MKEYKPETQWSIDGNLVYNLRFDGWRKSEPVMVNDVAVHITTRQPDAIKKQIAAVIATALNKEFFIKDRK